MGIQGSGRLRGRWERRFALSVTTILGAGLAFPALAQSPHPNIDSNGVDLTTGLFELRIPVASIGSGQSELPLIAYDGQTDNWSNIWLYQETSGGTIRYAVVLGRTFDNFTSGVAASTRGTGATLTGTPTEMTYRTRTGVEVVFTNPRGTSTAASNLCDENNTALCYLLPQSISGLSRMRVDLEWEIDSVCSGLPMPDEDQPCTHNWRLTSVSNLAGYSAAWTYASDNPGTGPVWHRPTSVALKNGGSTVSTVTYANPSSGIYTITAPGGGVWRIAGSGNVITGVRRPGASSDTTSITRSAGVVTSITNDGITTNYSRSVSGSTVTMVVTDAQSNVTTVVSDLNKYRPTSITNALNKTTGMTYDSLSRLTEIANPEGDKVQYSYDSRSNLTEVRRKAKPGSGLSDIVTSASFPASCTVPSCDNPDTTTDERGNVTNYSYDATTGLTTAVTLPAATSGAKRAEARFSYTLNAAGVYLLTGVSQCRTGAASDAPSCVGTADETKQTIAYDANLNPTSVTIAAGDNSLSATTVSSYSAAGNLLTVNGPLSGNDDTTTYRYDSDRRILGATLPDPDGAGPLKRRAQKVTYDAAGRVTDTEIGTVTGTSDTDWAAFASAEKLSTTYDANGFKTKEVSSAAATTYGVTQYSYDSLGRLQCIATRMNSGSWGALPSDACTLQTAGSFGDDRITRSLYDGLGRVTKVQTGYATGAQADEETSTYTDNGKVASVTDAEGNKTSYIYDGFDRLSRSQYPNLGKGAGTSSSTDYEELVYDAASNVTSRRLRGYAGDSSKHVDYAYDTLNRIVSKDLPGSEPDVTYGYDLQGHLVSASQSGNSLTFGIDSLGRNVSQGGPLGTVSYQYDAAGRRIRMTWPDSFYVTYDYQVTDEVSAIRENGSTALASYGYDDFGRRISITRGNGTTTNYAFDAVSRLSSITQNLDGSGTSNDVTTSFGYSPASQIVTQTRTNDAYAWGAHFNVNRGYTSNGLNQLTASGGTSLGYDVRGNLTASGSDSFSYSSENLLLSATVGGASSAFSYDPALRLYQISSSVTDRFQYDGSDLISEYNGANALQKRYVHGPGMDEPLVEYDAGGNKTYLHSDERGSIVALTNASGATTRINSYDEYGIPGSANGGRFQYTGQAWLGGVGVYYYKARLYSPSLGRFMQTDPIGYDDGMNWYAYVGNDPLNFTDPGGNASEDITVTGSRLHFSNPGFLSLISRPGSGAGAEAVAQTAPTPNPEEVVENEPIVAVGRRRKPVKALPAGVRDVTEELRRIQAPAIAACKGRGWGSQDCKNKTAKAGREIKWLCRNTGGCFRSGGRIVTVGPNRVADENTGPICQGLWTTSGGLGGLLLGGFGSAVLGGMANTASAKICPSKGQEY